MGPNARRRQTSRPGRRHLRAWLTVVVILAAVAAVLLVLTPPSVTGGSPGTTAPVTGSTVPVGATQTRTDPGTSSVDLRQWATPLWRAITSDDAAAGLPDVLPGSVFDALVGGSSDVAGEYVADVQAPYQLDVESYHGEVGPRTTLLRVTATSPARWVRAATCHTTAGFWFLPEVAVTYAVNGRNHHVGFDDLVSWRGQWFVGRFGTTSDTVGPLSVVTSAGAASASLVCPTNPQR